MAKNITDQLDFIFKPKSVAFIGASNNPVKWGGRIIRSALESNFRGRIYPVNPNEKEIRGLRAYADVNEIEGPVDLAVFTVPAAHMPTVMKKCVEKRIRGGVIISADFAETGEKGKALEEETRAIARAGNLRFMGPNCNGMWTSAVGLNICPMPYNGKGNLAFVSQSGMFGGIAIRASWARGFGLSKFIAMGNQGDLTAADYLEYLAEDNDTKVIALYMEGFKDGRKFIDVAGEVTQNKPVLIFKGGSSDVGARATLSHTASIAGEDDVFDGMCRQAGLIRVKQLEHLFIMAEALLGQPLPAGNRIAVIGNGGQGVTTCDNLSQAGLIMPEFEEADKQRLKAALPSHAPVPNNPVDFAAGGQDMMEEVRVIETLASFDYIDGIIANLPHELAHRKTVAERKKAIIDALDVFSSIPKKYGKPLITQAMMPSPTATELLRKARIPMCNTPEESVLAMDALVKYAGIRDKRD